MGSIIVVGNTKATVNKPITNAGTLFDTLSIASQSNDPLDLISDANAASIATEIKMHTICTTLIHFLFLTWTSKDISATSVNQIKIFTLGHFGPVDKAAIYKEGKGSKPILSQRPDRSQPQPAAAACAASSALLA